MSNPHFRIVIFCLVMCLVTGIIVFTLTADLNKKIAVVDAIQLFNQYNMKKELETREKNQLLSINAQVDSLANKLKMAQATNNEGEIQSAASAYNYMKARLQNEYTQGNQDINEQVWKRLNPIMDEYGKKHKFHLIIGANGMGTVLYNDEYFDITKDVIKYANSRYEEGN